MHEPDPDDLQLINYLIRKYSDIKYIIVNDKKVRLKKVKPKDKHDSLSEYIHKLHAIQHEAISDIINDGYMRVVFTFGYMCVLNYNPHSLSEAAIDVVDIYSVRQLYYYIDGVEYDYDDWVKNPVIRQSKIKKLLNVRRL